LMAMPIGRDRRAVEAIPLRLLIVAVVACMSVVPAAGALQSLQDRSFLDRCTIQLETIVATAQVVALEGLGARRTVDVDLASEGPLRMSSLAIGGPWMDPHMSSAVLELSSGRRLIRQAEEPFAWLASESLDMLVVRSPVFELSLMASESEGEGLVLCEVVPWTS
jgi:hypothetical protein